MKRTNYILIIIAIIAMTMQSCEKEFDSDLKVIDRFTLFETEQLWIEIESGNGGYKVESKDENIVMARIEDDSSIKVFGMKEGVADIVVSDASGQRKTIEVKVGIIPYYFTGDLSRTFSFFGLELEAEVDDITGHITFSILPASCDKLIGVGFKPEKTFTTSEMRSIINEGESKERLDFIHKPDDLSLQYSFGVLDEGTCYYLVHLDFSKIDILETENGDISVLTKGLCTYVRDR